MKIKNKKGFSLVMAIMIVTVLFIMAAGFFSITDYSTRSVNTNVENLRLYWAAESASYYSVNWWANQPDSVRKKWPNVYFTPESKSSSMIKDDYGTKVPETGFANAAGTTAFGSLYMHASSVYEGNAQEQNSDLDNYGDYKLITTRYKGPRMGKPEQAVWVLDSYAYNPKTGDMTNICLANVYNFMRQQELEPFIHSELINATMAGTGFHGVKGRFNEQDYRYGPCYYADLVHYDYVTGAVKVGPKFYGLVKSSAWKRITDPFNPTNTVSWYKNEGSRFTNKTGDYYTGLGLNSSKIGDEAEAEEWAKTSLLGGYDKNAKWINTDAVVWTWPSVEKYGPEEGLYFLEDGLFTAGSSIKVVLETKADATGYLTTKALIYNNSTLQKTLTIGDAPGSFKGVAVREKYGTVYFNGVSNEDFSLITQKDQVQITDHLYVYGAEPILSVVKGYDASGTSMTPTAEMLKKIWEMMNGDKVEGHLAVIAGLDMTAAEADKMPPIYIQDNNKLVFSTAAYISQFGELNSKGTGNTNLKLYNIGPVMTLDTQTKMTGPSDTAQKWSKVFLQDQRYLNEDEDLPPFCGEDPGLHPNEDTQGLNRNHRWASSSHSKVSNWETVVWRNGKPNF
jgi:hypothetical protein